MKSSFVKTTIYTLLLSLFCWSSLSAASKSNNVGSQSSIKTLNLKSVDQSAEEVIFFEGTVEGAKAKAKKESKFYFIEFYAKWCEPCKWMDEYTFKDASLSSYVGQNYVPVKVDVENLDGFIWKQKYKVQYLPTIVVLNSNGALLGKYEKSLTAEDLMRILKNHRTLPGEAVTETAEIVAIPVKTNPTSTATAAFVSVSNEPGLPKASDVKKAATNTKPTKPVAKPVATVKPAPAPTAANSNEYRVQVGVYTDAVNVANQVSKLKKTYPQTVQVFNLKNKETNSISYRITLGKFDTKEEAAQFAATLKSQGIIGVIKHISELDQKY